MRQLAPLCFTLLALSLSVGSVAEAQDQDPRIAEAQQHFERGEQHYEAAEYALALAQYEQAMSLMEEAGHRNAVLVLYSIALCNQEMGRRQVALETYQRFLAESPPDAPFRDVAERQVAELERQIELTGGDDATGTAGTTSAGGGGEVVSPIGVVIAAVGGAALIAGAVLGGVALGDSDAARADCVDDVCPTNAEAAIADAHTLANVADGLLWGGLAVAATGVVLMFVLADGGDDAEASAICTPDGCAATVRGRF